MVCPSDPPVEDLAIPWLIILATDPDPTSRRAARQELAARLQRRVYEPIREDLLHHRHPEVRAIVAESLGLRLTSSLGDEVVTALAIAADTPLHDEDLQNGSPPNRNPGA